MELPRYWRQTAGHNGSNSILSLRSQSRKDGGPEGDFLVGVSALSSIQCLDTVDWQQKVHLFCCNHYHRFFVGGQELNMGVMPNKNAG